MRWSAQSSMKIFLKEFFASAETSGYFSKTKKIRFPFLSPKGIEVGELSLPSLISLVRFREAWRALTLRDSLPLLRRSSSSTTVIGITTSCSSKLNIAFGSWISTLVSRTKVRFLVLLDLGIILNFWFIFVNVPFYDRISRQDIILPPFYLLYICLTYVYCITHII